MRRLLNTIYITNEQAYLCLDGETLVCKTDDTEKFRVPFDNIENIVCFSYLGCSPALMGKCVEKTIPINFISPHGKFWAKICGETKGNVFLRVAQLDCFREHGLSLAQNTMAAKFSNSKQLIRRSLHDNSELRSDSQIAQTMQTLSEGISSVYQAKNIEEVVGIEGNCAKSYFSVFDKLITCKRSPFVFEHRSKHPPLDPVNCVLSFLYSLLTSDFAAALETVGLDSYIGFCHTLRSGRCSLACDLVEELRCFAERFTLSLLNLNVLDNNDFETQVSGAVWLNDTGRKKVITRWQEKKRTDIFHPYLKQKIPFGLLPYIQSNLLAKYVRGEIAEYPCFLIK